MLAEVTSGSNLNFFYFIHPFLDWKIYYFFIPSFAWNKILNDNNAIGIAVYGNGGMNTDYPTDTFHDPINSDDTGVDLMQLFIAPTYAHKFAEKHSIGITPIIAAQFFEARGLTMFGMMSSAPDKITNNSFCSTGRRLPKSILETSRSSFLASFLIFSN